MPTSTSLVIIAHNIRSAHNVGALLRTAEGLGVTKVYFTGYTPYPRHDNDERLPHLAEKMTQQINKTALGAQNSLAWERIEDIQELLAALRKKGFQLAGLEQASNSVSLINFKPPAKLALLLGSEVTGVDNELLEKLDFCLEIPMRGEKESYNVVEAATMAMYQCLLVSQ
jgi:23S rRNA (guanosine2251-2'-O)-methyltransferase